VLECCFKILAHRLILTPDCICLIGLLEDIGCMRLLMHKEWSKILDI